MEVFVYCDVYRFDMDGLVFFIEVYIYDFFRLRSRIFLEF